MKRAFILILVATAAVAQDRSADWRADIAYLRTELPRRHPNLFFALPRAEFERGLEEVATDVPFLTDDEVRIRFQQVVARLRDAHTTLDFRPSRQTYLPFRFAWFRDGLFIVRTSPEYAGVCGMRVTGIGELTVEDAYQRVKSILPHENEQWPLALSETWFPVVEVLRGVGVIDESEAIPFTFEDSAGRVVQVLVRPSATPLPAEPLRDTTPLYRRTPDAFYWFTYVPEQRLLYVKYDVCRDDPRDPMAAFAQRVFAVADREPIERFVLDLRHNTGGNSEVINPLIAGLRARPRLMVFAAIGPRTFSSGMIAAWKVRMETRGTLIGTPTGGKPNAYGDTLDFLLPRTRVRVTHSTKLFTIVSGNPDSIDPDVEVPTTSADWFADRDPILEFIVGGKAADGVRRRAAGAIGSRCR